MIQGARQDPGKAAREGGITVNLVKDRGDRLKILRHFYATPIDFECTKKVEECRHYTYSYEGRP